MSEAIIARGGGSNGGGQQTIVNDAYIITNQMYTIPATGNYLITCVGGGAGGSDSYVFRRHESEGFEWNNWYARGGNGGGSGNVNSKQIYLNANTAVRVSIGSGGKKGTSGASGGTTSFGSYISASGGSGIGGYNNSTKGDTFWANYNISQMNNFMDNDHIFTNLIRGYTGGFLYNNGYNVYNFYNGSRLYFGDGGNGKTLTNITFGYTTTHNGTSAGLLGGAGWSRSTNGNNGICIVHFLG